MFSTKLNKNCMSYSDFIDVGSLISRFKDFYIIDSVYRLRKIGLALWILTGFLHSMNYSFYALGYSITDPGVSLLH